MTRTARRGVENKKVNEATSWSEMRKHKIGSSGNAGIISYITQTISTSLIELF